MLFIPFSDFYFIGGPSTFMNNLKIFLDINNFLYDSSFKSDSIFFPISYNIKTLKLIKKEKGKIIQRLDGVWYPSKHGKKYVKITKNVKTIYQKYSNYIIFQSEYSKKQCFELFGEKDAVNYSLIINGVDKTIFFPSKNTKQHDQVQFITTGNFRNLDMLEPIIFSLDSLQEKFDFKLHVVGPIVNNLLKPLLNRDYVVKHGLKNMEEISSLLQDSDIFIYSHLNPPCPNSVVEAISCGLPIVGFDSGAMSELCFFSKDLFAYVSEDIFQKYEDFKPVALTEKIELCINNYEYYKKLAMENAHLYSFEECGKKYVDVFNKVLSENKRNKRKKRNKNTLKKILKILLSKIIIKLTKKISDEGFLAMMFSEINWRLDHNNPENGLKFLFNIENNLYKIEEQASICYAKGLFSKHKHIKYHDFFITNIPIGSSVLNIGCDNGALASYIADNVKEIDIYRIDIEKQNIEKIKENYARCNIIYACGNTLTDLPDKSFGIIVLSNALEYIENRIEFLSILNKKYNPKKFLIRVPCFDRDWRVPLKKKLGLEFRLDEGYFTEYLYDEFEDEITQSGLFIESAKINWGEIWAIVKKIK